MKSFESRYQPYWGDLHNHNHNHNAVDYCMIFPQDHDRQPIGWLRPDHESTKLGRGLTPRFFCRIDGCRGDRVFVVYPTFAPSSRPIGLARGPRGGDCDG